MNVGIWKMYYLCNFSVNLNVFSNKKYLKIRQARHWDYQEYVNSSPSQQWNEKKKKTHFLSGQKSWTDTTKKKICKWPVSTGNGAQITSMKKL